MDNSVAVILLECGHVHTIVFPPLTPLEIQIQISAELAEQPPACDICRIKRESIAAQN